MISKILLAIGADLGQHLRGRFNLSEDPVVLSNLVGLDGSVAVEGENKIVLTLVNIEQETSIPKMAISTPIGPTSSLAGAPPVFINLMVLVSAFFQSSNYGESLKSLSQVISYFQQKPIFTRQNVSGWIDTVPKVTAEILNLSLTELSNLWGQLGGKYLPSIVYKLRMITFDCNYPTAIIDTVAGYDTKVSKS